MAVEEQFYLVWPGVLAVLLAVTRTRKQLIAVVGGVLLALLLLRVYGNLNWGFRRVYYAPDTNAYALLVGALLALCHNLQPWKQLPYRLITSFALIFLLSISLAPSVDFNGLDRIIQLWVAPVASLVAAVVIQSSFASSSVLAWPPLVYVGKKLSYAWYLWHIILRDIFTQAFGETFFVVVGAIVASLGVAVASWYLVEQPMLRRKARFERVQP